METIVVGFDGSEGGEAALEFAAKEAALRGARILAVTAWEIPPSVMAGVVAGSGFYAEFRENAVRVAAEASVRLAQLQPSVPHEERVVEGQAGNVLLEEAKDAALIVVGSRGHGGFAGLFLGSISQQVVHHAHCPVVVVPGKTVPKK